MIINDVSDRNKRMISIGYEINYKSMLMKKRNDWIRLILLIGCVFSLFTADAASMRKVYEWKGEIEQLKRIDLLPVYRTGCVVEQVSSYDPTGGNNDGFSGQYSYIRKEEGKLVLADLQGPGVINRIWTPTPTDDTLSFYFDGEKVPRLEIRFRDLFSGNVYPFVKPVCGNEVGGFYCYLPIPYRKSCKIVFSGEKIMFHQIQYRNLPGYEVESYSASLANGARELLKEVGEVWSDISPEIKNYADGKSAGHRMEEKTFTLLPGQEELFFESNVPGRITGFEIDGGDGFEGLRKDVILRARWDEDTRDAIYAPVADFFGYAFGKGAMRSMLIGKRQQTNYCYMPSPFDQKAVMRLSYLKRDGIKQSPIQITTRVYYTSVPRDRGQEGKFYALWRREINPPVGTFYGFADLRGKGHYVGTVHQAQGLRPEMTIFFEGDDSTYVDGKVRLHGTGSEDYYNGGWYALLDRWDRGVSLPIHGSLDYSLPMSRTGGYRFYLTDKMSFEKELYLGIEHGPEGNAYPVDYTSVAYYYAGSPLGEGLIPSEDLRTVYRPEEHVFYPQLMDIALGNGIRMTHQRGIHTVADPGGMFRVMLNDVPEGNYEVFISYLKRPEGSNFRVWQRQKCLSDWISAKGSDEQLKEKVKIGEIVLTPQTNSLSFDVQKDNEGDVFELERIYLKRIK